MESSLPGSSICQILQARILEWVVIPFSRGSSEPRDWTQVSGIADSLLSEPSVKPLGSQRVRHSWTANTFIFFFQTFINLANIYWAPTGYEALAVCSGCSGDGASLGPRPAVTALLQSGPRTQFACQNSAWVGPCPSGAQLWSGPWQVWFCFLLFKYLFSKQGAFFFFN